MRISDWSSDVCSSDLGRDQDRRPLAGAQVAEAREQVADHDDLLLDGGARRGQDQDRDRPPLLGEVGGADADADAEGAAGEEDRKSVVWGKSVSVRVDLGGRRIIKKKKKKKNNN